MHHYFWTIFRNSGYSAVCMFTLHWQGRFQVIQGLPQKVTSYNSFFAFKVLGTIATISVVN